MLGLVSESSLGLELVPSGVRVRLRIRVLGLRYQHDSVRVLECQGIQDGVSALGLGSDMLRVRVRVRVRGRVRLGGQL